MIGLKVAQAQSSKKQEAKSVSQWRVFIEGAVIYITALTLPTLIGYVMLQFSEPQRDEYVDASSSPFCQNLEYYAGSYAASFVCEPPQEKTPPMIAADTVTDDIALICALSLLLAGVRMLLLQYLCPTFPNMARNQSWHLLSMDYSPTSSPRTPPRPVVSHSIHAEMLQSQLRELEEEEQQQQQQHSSLDAPRYATALFRLLFCTVSCTLAWLYFSDANFWPFVVGGSGATKQCWDLSGGLTIAMDSDFDHRNYHLKRYFLLQASYHWQSGTFHVLSMILSKFRPQALPRFFRQATTRQFVKSLGQHMIGLLFIGVAYVFSSLRRLTAIGMFAFDVSSWFLHVLQIAFTRRWKKSTTIKLYKYLILPSFVYTRFIVWPVLWYSAVTESQHWFAQFESTFVPGSSLVIQSILNAIMVLTMGLTIVYFKRLLRHPHLRRIMK